MLELLQCSYLERKKIRENLNESDDSIKEKVTILRMWIKSQPHFPELTGDDIIERFLLINKASVERAKNKLDMYYTIRTLIPEFYAKTNPKLPKMQQIMDVIYVLPLPQLTDNFNRIIIIKIKDPNPDIFDPYLFFAMNINLLEIRLHEDYINGDVVIYDLENITAGHLKKITPSFIKKLSAVLENVYSSRMQAIHFLNCSNFFHILLPLAKTALKPKIAKRIHAHKEISSLFNYLPRKLLPKDYGGEQGTLSEINDVLKQKYVQYETRFDKLDGMKVDESARPAKLKDDKILGFYGNFKKLNVD